MLLQICINCCICVSTKYCRRWWECGISFDWWRCQTGHYCDWRKLSMSYLPYCNVSCPNISLPGLENCVREGKKGISETRHLACTQIKCSLVWALHCILYNQLQHFSHCLRIESKRFEVLEMAIGNLSMSWWLLNSISPFVAWELKFRNCKHEWKNLYLSREGRRYMFDLFTDDLWRFSLLVHICTRTVVLLSHQICDDHFCIESKEWGVPVALINVLLTSAVTVNITTLVWICFPLWIFLGCVHENCKSWLVKSFLRYIIIF